MIVYNVGRGWFAEKAEAEKTRKAAGLKPAATAKVTVNSREDLATLLNALCEPQKAAKALREAVASQAVVDRAFVDPTKSEFSDIPSFLLRDLKTNPEAQAELRRRGAGGAQEDVFG